MANANAAVAARPTIILMITNIESRNCAVSPLPRLLLLPPSTEPPPLLLLLALLLDIIFLAIFLTLVSSRPGRRSWDGCTMVAR